LAREVASTLAPQALKDIEFASVGEGIKGMEVDCGTA